MSGGHYDYKYFEIEQLAFDIENDFENDGKRKDEYTEWDMLSDTTSEEKNIILKEIKSLVKDLKNVAVRVKALDWFMSGDTGPTSYLEELKSNGIKI